MRRRTLVLLLAATLVHGNGADDLYWEGESDEFLQVNAPAPAAGLGARVRRLRDTLWDMWDSKNEIADVGYDEGDSRRSKRQNDIQSDLEDNTEDSRMIDDIEKESKNSFTDDTETGAEIGSGTPPQQNIPRKKEVSVQVSFVLREPYEEAFSNRDSSDFQGLSHKLADAVNALYDKVPGTQRASLVRIQSRLSDAFSCKVSMDLVSTNYFDMEHLKNTLLDQIQNMRRLSDLEVSAEEFEFERNDLLEGETCSETEFRCGDGKCVPADAHCNGIVDCSDQFDEYGCRENAPEFDEQELDEDHDLQGKEILIQDPLDRQLEAESTSTKTTTLYPACPESSMPCDGARRCVPLSERCDGRQQCDDGADEMNCPKICGLSEFKCDDGQCVPSVATCNRVFDCKNGEDERNCPCTADEFRCDNTCIERRKVCDRYQDCSDGSDESDCGTDTACSPDQWQCDYGACVDRSKRCDGHLDCPSDRSDERNCPDCATQCGDGTCLMDEQVCDGIKDCSDGTDELPENCQSCRQDEFKCRDGECIPKSHYCNGYFDCTDESDEENCPITPAPLNETCAENSFQCADGQCVNEHFRCDEHEDCDDGSDEEGCPRRECRSDQWRCLSGECIDQRLKCDTIADCADGSDEMSPPCPPPATPMPAPAPEPYTPDYGRADRLPARPPVDVTTAPWADPWYTTRAPSVWPPRTEPPRTSAPEYTTDRNGLNLKAYDAPQQVKEGDDVVFRCRDEGSTRAPVAWAREAGRPMPTGYKDDGKGRLELYNVKKEDGGSYICQAVGFNKYYPGSEISVHLSVTPRARGAGSFPPISCRPDEATCSNGQCIARSAICDGNYNCTDGSDEASCRHGNECEPNEFRCNNKRCVSKLWVCDSEDDCQDGSDEAVCVRAPPGAPCQSNEFSCRSKQCVPRSFHCDGHNDCMDGSDEVGCVKVYISEPPPRSKFLSMGDTMTLTCRAVGEPTPEVIWRLNWGHIPPKCTYTSINGLGTLTCPDVQSSDQGAYSCEAMNNKGSVFAVPDTILTVNGSSTEDVCPTGYFNSEARSPQDCITCFCFGVSTRCESADLFTFQLPTPLGEGGTLLLGLVQEPTGQLTFSEQPISDLFYYQPGTARNAATVMKMVDSTVRDVHPYLTLPESYNGIQLTSYGGFLKYNLRPHNRRPVYSNLPDIVIKGKYSTLVHHAKYVDAPRPVISMEARLLPQYWSKTTPNGIIPATREDIMMALDNVERIMLRAEVNGGGVNISDFAMDSAQRANSGRGAANFVEECECPVGYSGLSCQKCADGYVRESSGPWLGHCREAEAACPPGTYGEPRRGVPCRPCPCPSTSPPNQFARTCHLGSDGDVVCDCSPGYEGLRCERCADGLVGNPLQPGDSCRQPPRSRCDPDGTLSEARGACVCKDRVQGPYCDQCKADSFFLSSDNPHGCAQCFCMGVTDKCGSSNLRRRTISSRFGSPQQKPTAIYQVEGLSSRFTNPRKSDMQPVAYGGELVLRDFDRSPLNTYYWSLPDSFQGDKVTSYGGYLTYAVRHHPPPNGQSLRNKAADVILISLNGMSFSYFGNTSPSHDGYLNGSVHFLEKYWKRSDGNNLQRSDFLMALADVDALLVKATYTGDTREAALVSASLEIAEEGGSGPRALHVEQCHCNRNYTGSSCEDCAPGFTRGSAGIYLEICIQCECNGHSSQCHPETGLCLACQHNTDGEHCEECLPGYALDRDNNCVLEDGGDPGAEGLECRCDPRGEAAPCSYGQCQCKANVDGSSCNSCRPGTFNLAADNPTGCHSCYCSGVTRDCQAASYYTRIPIPVVAITEEHGFRLMTIEADVVINDNIILNQQSNQLGYIFGRPPRNQLYWSLPTLPGNRITSYGGKLMLTQKYESVSYQDTSNPSMNVVLVGNDLSIYWTNPRTIRPAETLVYQVLLKESEWFDLATARPATRDQLLSVLAELRRVLVLATLSPGVTSTYISDISMDTAIPNKDDAGNADDVELCQCPAGYRGTSCEQCDSGFYRDLSRRCVECPCSGRADSCQLAPNGEVLCNCKAPYNGRDCGAVGVTMELHPIVHEEDEDSSKSDYQKNVTLTCRYHAPEPLSIQFIFDGKEILPVKHFSQSKCNGESCQGEYSWNTTWDTRRRGNIVECHTITRKNYTLGMLTTSLGSGDSTSAVPTSRRPPTPSTVTVQITKPLIEIVALGSTVNFTCTARSRLRNYPLEVGWSKAGGSLPRDRAVADERSGLLVISDVQVSDSGTYICTATDGVAYSRDTVSFTVPANDNSEPTVTISPAFLEASEGDPVVLECHATGNPLPRVTWLRANNQAMPYSSEFAGNALRIESARVSDSGEYRCLARNEVGTSESTAAIVVTRRPSQPVPVQLTITPSQPNVQEGQRAQIVCSASRDLPRDTLQWTMEGTYNLPTNTRTYDGILYIDGATTENTGVYVCQSSTLEYVVSPVQVAVNVRPLQPTTAAPGDEPGIVLRPNATTIPAGESRTIDCVPTGYPLPLIKWKKYEGTFRPGVSQRANSLVISQAQESDYGYYVCEASRPDGTLVTQAYLSVVIERREKPRMEIWPSGVQKVTLGSSLELRCRVLAGDPEPTVSWSRRPPGPFSIYTQILPDNVLRLSNITVSDEGEFVCTGYNDAGESTVGTTLSVQSPPKMIINPQNNIETVLGQPIRVDCRASGYPEPMVYWRKETPESRELGPPTPSIASIRVPAASLQDEGTYTCIAQSSAGKIQDQIYITVETAPDYNTGAEGSGDDPGSTYDPRPQPTPYYVAEGSDFNLKCNATGPGNVIVSWTRADGYPMQPNYVHNRETLSLFRVTSRDSGIYQCSGRDRRTGDAVFASQTRLVVERPPRITLRPATQVVRPGQIANVECLVDGDQPLNITWQPQSGYFSPRAEIRIPYLRFNRIEVEDAGKYICFARNRVGEARGEAEVKVTEHVSPPRTVSHDHTQRAQAGSLVQLSCNVTEPGVFIWWTKDDAHLPNRVQQTNGILRFPKVQRADTGRYICHIRDTYGGNTQNYIDLYIDEPVKVTARVVIERPSRPETVGNNVTVTCRSSPNDLQLHWERPGANGLNQFVNSQNTPGQSVLDIPGVQLADAGIYRCRGESQDDEITDEFTLMVIPAPATVRPRPLEPETHVYSSPLGTEISLPCTNDLQQYAVEWRREYGPLPSYVNPQDSELRLRNISETDAGTYICRVNSEDLVMESRVILKVTHVVPKFQGQSWLSLNPLPPSDLFNKLAFEISIKPQALDGLVLYNSENPGRTGDMIALRLVNGVPEFQFNAGSGVVKLRADRPLDLDMWHTIRVSRNSEKLMMSVDNNGPFSTNYIGNPYQGLELLEPIYIGGVPDYTQLPDSLTDTNGFEGCVSMLILGREEVSLMRDRRDDSGNLGQCDTCTPNPCRNSGICQEAQNERGFTCLCPAGYAGHDCGRTGEACRPGLCGTGKCHDTEDSYKCSCPITHTGRRCETLQAIEYPAFSGSAFLAFKAPKTSRTLRLSMKIKPAAPVTNGIIMYCSESPVGINGFTSLAVRNGYLEFRYDVGDNSGPVILTYPRQLQAYEWTEVLINRQAYQISMTINVNETVRGELPQSSWPKQMRWYTPMYVGGYDDKEVILNNKTEVTGGFNGCIKDLTVLGSKIDIVKAPIQSANVQECSNDGPQRGDITADDLSTTANEIEECQCRNGGVCRSGGACDCPPGYHGAYCEHRRSADHCAAQPCRAGGVCRNTPQGHECDCPLGYTGYNCQTNVRVNKNVKFAGNGHLALPASHFNHDRPPQSVAMRLSTQQDGVILYQHSTTSQPGLGDFVLLQVEQGFATLHWDVGGGVGNVINQIPITDGASHRVFLKIEEGTATLEVDDIPVTGTAPGFATQLNADSAIYLGGIPQDLNWRKLPGFNGCFEQVEFNDYATAMDLGSLAQSGVNVDRCWG